MQNPSNSLSAETLLSREAAAQALSAAGYITSPSTLATKATRGNGPGYRIFGKRAIYRWGDLISWAEEQTAPLRHNTSEIKQALVPESIT
jgi:hypothetical protein